MALTKITDTVLNSDKIGNLSSLNTTNKGSLVAAVNENTALLAENVNGLNEKKYAYSYNTDGSVQSITEKNVNDTIISTTTFTYKSNGDVDTSVKVMGSESITTQFIYDANGNLTDTINTKS